MSIRKFLIIAIAIFMTLTVIIVIIWVNLSAKSSPQNIPGRVPVPTEIYYRQPTEAIINKAFPTVVVSLPPTDKVIISGVIVNNFFPKATKVNEYGDYYLVKKDGYNILYEFQFNQFLISILDSPFRELKKTAENDLISVLGINKQDACKLNVVISTPLFANSEEAGKNYKMSFCEK